MNEASVISKAMSILGSRTSRRKARASRKNADLAWRARWKNHKKKSRQPKIRAAQVVDVELLENGR